MYCRFKQMQREITIVMLYPLSPVTRTLTPMKSVRRWPGCIAVAIWWSSSLECSSKPSFTTKVSRVPLPNTFTLHPNMTIHQIHKPAPPCQSELKLKTNLSSINHFKVRNRWSTSDHTSFKLLNRGLCHCSFWW